MLQEDKEKHASSTSNIAGPEILLTVLFSFIGDVLSGASLESARPFRFGLWVADQKAGRENTRRKRTVYFQLLNSHSILAFKIAAYSFIRGGLAASGL
jgi:hypothetical protein